MAIRVRDRRGSIVELTDERWAHIGEAHPELIDYQEQILDTVRWGVEVKILSIRPCGNTVVHGLISPGTLRI